MKKPPPRGHEESLLELLFKYKQLMRQARFPMIEEREGDRQTLETFYPHIESMTERILDSKIYRQLGEVQRKVTDNFLADTIPPEQRLAMLAFIVRSMNYPLFFISGRGTLANLEQSKVRVEALDPPAPERVSEIALPGGVKSRKIDDPEIRLARERVVKLARKTDWNKLAPKLSVMEAEILSQLASKGEVEVVLKVPQAPPQGLRVALTFEGDSSHA